ncbi:hypothetical protein F5Y07DRAFT_41908 [Xylaria sp. FL0933]|nr:hypothetical protein F5Y07DRAFT_41908 [Xylaria sp. FL0933]
MPFPFTCGFCGTGHRQRVVNSQWSNYYRALYCIGLDSHEPRLSGLGFYQEDHINYLPPEAHQRYDDENIEPLSLIVFRGFSPPGPLEIEEDKRYTWGFRFHDACWKVMEQASAPKPVDLRIMWRILRSIPHTFNIPHWGHNFGGLYVGSRRQTNSGHFIPLERSSSLLIPSAYYNPFDVHELKARLAHERIKADDATSIAEMPEALGPLLLGSLDPFAILPVELREMILNCVDTGDILPFRLSSRAIAVTPLSQYFFQSRFWPGREFDYFFDAFLLPSSDKIGIDWKNFYRSSKERLKYGMVGLGERNRLRIWKQTLRPLTLAIDKIARLSELKGQSAADWPQDAGDGPKVSWKSIETSQSLDPELFGELKRHVIQTQIELPPSKIEAIHVSLIEFFGSKFISGLAFETEHGEDIEIGYIIPGSEEPLIVEAGLEGFHVVVDYCGFKAISPYTNQHMESEYLDWVGEREDLPVQALRCSGGVVRRIRATFDGFRMQSLHIPESDSGP